MSQHVGHQRVAPSVDQLYGAEALSQSDREIVEEGNETTIDRTLRLLYVTGSRAEEGLALIFWAKDPKAALDGINRSEWFAADKITDLE